MNAAEESDGCDYERPVERIAAVARVFSVGIRRNLEAEREQRHGIDPGPGAAQLVADLEAKDFPELHRGTSSIGSPLGGLKWPVSVLK
jgi:hypothetical protein